MKSARVAGDARRYLFMVLVAALSLTAGAVTLVHSAAPARADTPLACDQNTLYGIDSNGNLDAINATTGATTAMPAMSPAYNALGATVNGADAIGFSGTSNQITRYSTATGALTTFNSVDASAPATIIRGAVNPATGVYYYGGSGTNAYLGAFDTATNTPIGQIGTITGLTSGNGDFAFSSRGLMFVVSSNLVLRVNNPIVPTTAGNATLSTSTIATLPPTTNSPGIAFTTDGYLYVSNGSNLIKLDPASGTQVTTIPISGGFTPTDLASCNYPNTITAQADVAGRVHGSDQFGLSVTGGGIASGNTATTSGSATGVQPQKAGPALTLPTNRYTATETAAGTTDLSQYDTSYNCVNVNNNAVVAAGSGTTASFDFPAAVGADGTDVTCTFTNTPIIGTLAINAELGSARIDSTDQFAVAVRSGSPTGTMLSDPTNATTTGSGSSVAAGSGTSGTTTVPANGATYYQTGQLAPGSASSAGQYDRLISCTDVNGLQTGLPSNAPFAGSLALTPVQNAAITCVVTASAVAPTVQLSVGLSGDRYLDADQFAVAIHSGSATGPKLNATGSDTTTGTGAAVTPGTGTTGVVIGSATSAYYLTSAPTADTGRYAANVTCTDANGFQGGLPTGASYDGTLALSPVAGAAISCAVSYSASPAALVLGMTGPAQLIVGQAADYRLQVTNNGGTSSPATVTDALPAGMQYYSANGAGWSCVATGSVGTGQLLTCTSDPIGAGSTAPLAVTVIPAPAASGSTPVTKATVDPSGGTSPSSPAGCASTDPNTGCAVVGGVLVASGIDLELDQSAPAALTVGTPGDYLFTVTNTGTGPAPAATVVDTLPAGLTYLSATGATCATAGQVVTCTLTGPIAANGGTAQFTITVTPTAAAATTAVRNPAAVDPTAGGSPVDPTTCTATGSPAGCALADVVLVGTATLQLTATAAPVPPARAPLRAGDRVTYRYTVTNTGAADLANLQLRDRIAGPITCAATTLAAYAGTTCTSGPYTLTQADVDAGPLTDSATATADLAHCALPTCAPIPSNRAATTSPTVSTATLALAVIGAVHDSNHDGKANPGETISYTVTVSNAGAVTLHGITTTLTGVALGCPTTTLAPGQAMRCTGRYTLTAHDATTGRLQQIASATAATASGVQQVAAANQLATFGVDAVQTTLAATGQPLATDLALSAMLLAVGAAFILAGRRRTGRPRGRHRPTSVLLSQPGR